MENAVNIVSSIVELPRNTFERLSAHEVTSDCREHFKAEEIRIGSNF